MKTRQDLIAATLKLLNAIGAGQAPEAEDFEEIDRIIDGKLAELNEQDIYWSSDTQNFEDKFIDPLATILGDEAAPSFGQARSEERVATAIMRIRAMKPSTYVSGSPLAVDYF
ncbi:MAG: hypothetical protein QHC90_13180 [Shinella sp.]|nr:hypothetical protein [Shinella sp.]